MTNQDLSGPEHGVAPEPGPAFDPASVDRTDWAILAAGLLAFLFSFMEYYTFSYSGPGYSASVTADAWHGFFGWFAALSALAAAGALGAHLLRVLPARLPGRLVTLAGFALATLCVLIAFLVHPGSDYTGPGYLPPGFEAGHGVGYWLSLLVDAAGLALAYRRFTAENGVLPWQAKA
ncbi:hypothetical protein ACWCXH_39325 [Kitasatospora sp. NPDC001660]